MTPSHLKPNVVSSIFFFDRKYVCGYTLWPLQSESNDALNPFSLMYTEYAHTEYCLKANKTIIKTGNIMYKNIRMISEWSCDTEDWSNDAENSA